jgi:predicted metal-binding membrane protein
MSEMQMGLGSIGTFAAGWTVMLIAMMLPSATPLIYEFARNAEGRRGWQAATAVLGASYLGVWLAFGVVCYVLYSAAGMPWSSQERIGGMALVIAGVYAFTPVKRACDAWCRELRALRGALPFNLMRSAVVAGLRYAMSCVGCHAALMLAVVLIGMSNVGWMIALTTVMLVYRLAPAPTRRWSQLAISSALVAVGVLYVIGG